MTNTNFSLQIGKLTFGSASIGFILSGCFLLGILAGLISMIYIDGAADATVWSMPLLWAVIIPMVIIVKGIRKAETAERG